jgi:hypothetical protein
MDGVKLRMSTAPDALGAILSVSDLIRYTKQRWIKCEELSIEAVEDKSKANAFNKAVASIQISWFFSQFLGRLISIIPISPLECFTLAYVTCALFMYGFWWHKPFDVQTPLLIYPDPSLSAEQMLELKDSLYQLSTDRSEQDSLDDMLNLISGDISTMEEKHDRVWIRPASAQNIRGLGFVIPTVLFGSCHLFGWNYQFPTTSETYLWRVASISCVCIPLALLVLVVVVPINQPSGLWKTLGDVAYATLAIAYVLVRLFLLFEVFFALRSAPPEIYKAVPWAQYLPHI